MPQQHPNLPVTNKLVQHAAHGEVEGEGAVEQWGGHLRAKCCGLSALGLSPQSRRVILRYMYVVSLYKENEDYGENGGFRKGVGAVTGKHRMLETVHASLTLGGGLVTALVLYGL